MKYILITLAFILGLIFCMSYKSADFKENFDVKSDCPNLLIQKGKELHLVNKRKALVPGVNPITFQNLEEYVEYMEWMKANNINCPILYLQQTYNTQGERGYRMLPDPLEPQAGLPSNLPNTTAVAKLSKLANADRDEPPYNSHSYPGFDPQNQYSGLYTPLDQIECTQEQGIDNPMCDNWNDDIARQHLDQGKYLKRTRQDGGILQGQFQPTSPLNPVQQRNADIATKPNSRSVPELNRQLPNLSGAAPPMYGVPYKFPQESPEQRALNASV